MEKIIRKTIIITTEIMKMNYFFFFRIICNDDLLKTSQEIYIKRLNNGNTHFCFFNDLIYSQKYIKLIHYHLFMSL